MMKVAIIQEWLVSVGGSDKVVKAMADVFPDADIFTLVASFDVSARNLQPERERGKLSLGLT